MGSCLSPFMVLFLVFCLVLYLGVRGWGGWRLGVEGLGVRSWVSGPGVLWSCGLWPWVLVFGPWFLGAGVLGSRVLGKSAKKCPI